MNKNILLDLTEVSEDKRILLKNVLDAFEISYEEISGNNTPIPEELTELIRNIQYYLSNFTKEKNTVSDEIWGMLSAYRGEDSIEITKSRFKSRHNIDCVEKLLDWLDYYDKPIRRVLEAFIKNH